MSIFKYCETGLLIVWLTAWITKAICDVGTSYSGGIYDWKLPLAIASFMGTTALLAYLAKGEWE